MKNINFDESGVNKAYYDVIIGENKDNRSHEKVEKLIKKGGTYFSIIANKEINNYKIYLYKIEDISEGCNLYLKINTKISLN